MLRRLPLLQRRAWLWLFVIESLFAASCSFKETAAEFMLVDPDTLHCVNCSGGGQQELVAQVVSKKSALHVSEWIAQFAGPNDQFAAPVFANSPLSEKHLELADAIADPDGVTFSFPDLKVSYFCERSTFFDYYVPHMVLESEDGSIRWSRRVPSLDVPVYPLIQDDVIMYIGRAQESRQAIIFLDLGTGRIKQKVILPYDRETSVSARNPIEYFPAYVDGFVVVGGGSLVIHGDPLASTTERNFQPGPLLVMAFPW